MKELEIIEALANRHRLQILECIAQTNNNGVIVSTLVEILDIAQPTITHHLNKMVAAGVLKMENDGHFHLYTINKNALRKVTIFILNLLDKCPEIEKEI